MRVQQAYGLPVGRPVFGIWTSVFSRTDSDAPRFFRLTPSATIGLGSGFEGSGSVLFEGAEQDLDGPYDRSFEVRRRDLSAKLRWSGPLGTTRFRIGAEGLLGVPLGPGERAGGTREPDGRVDPGVVGLVSTNVGKFRFPIRVHGNVGYWWSRNDGAYYYRDFPAPIAIPGSNGANNVLTAGLGLEFGLRRALLIAELTTEQFQEARANIHGRENLWQLTVGARGHLTNTIGITGAMSFDVSKDSDDTLFDPSGVYPDAQLRVGLTFGAVASRESYEERRRADEQKRRDSKQAIDRSPQFPVSASVPVAPEKIEPSVALQNDAPPLRTTTEVEMQRVVRELEARVRSLEMESRVAQLERRLAQLETPGTPGSMNASPAPSVRVPATSATLPSEARPDARNDDVVPPAVKPEPPIESSAAAIPTSAAQPRSTTESEPLSAANPTTDAEQLSTADPTTDAEQLSTVNPTTDSEQLSAVNPTTQSDQLSAADPKGEPEQVLVADPQRESDRALAAASPAEPRSSVESVESVESVSASVPQPQSALPVVETTRAEASKTPAVIRLPDVSAAPSVSVTPETAKQGTSLGVGAAAGLGAVGGAALSTLAQPRSSSSRGSVVIVETTEGNAGTAVPVTPTSRPVVPPTDSMSFAADPNVTPLDQLIREYRLSREATAPIESAPESTPASDVAMLSPEETDDEIPDAVIDVPMVDAFALPAPEERRVLEGIDLMTSSPPADDHTRATLEVLASALATEPHARISLDVFGAPGDSTSTSEEQTRSIVDYLLVAGAGPDQVVATTRGPSADGARVEIEGLAPHVAAPAETDSTEAGS